MEEEERKATTKIEKVEIVEGLLKKLEGIVTDGFRTMRADMGLVANDLSLLKDRMDIVEKWKIEQDQRASRNSTRVEEMRASSVSTNLEQDSKIAEGIIKQQELEKQNAETHANTVAVREDVVQIREELALMKERTNTLLAESSSNLAMMTSFKKAASEVWSNPRFQMVATALLTALATKLLTWLTGAPTGGGGTIPPIFP